MLSQGYDTKEIDSNSKAVAADNTTFENLSKKASTAYSTLINSPDYNGSFYDEQQKLVNGQLDVSPSDFHKIQYPRLKNELGYKSRAKYEATVQPMVASIMDAQRYLDAGDMIGYRRTMGYNSASNPNGEQLTPVKMTDNIGKDIHKYVWNNPAHKGFSDKQKKEIEKTIQDSSGYTEIVKQTKNLAASAKEARVAANNIISKKLDNRKKIWKSDHSVFGKAGKGVRRLVDKTTSEYPVFAEHPELLYMLVPTVTNIKGSRVLGAKNENMSADDLTGSLAKAAREYVMSHPQEYPDVTMAYRNQMRR
jgi:uncharacterized protein YukE